MAMWIPIGAPQQCRKHNLSFQWKGPVNGPFLFKLHRQPRDGLFVQPDLSFTQSFKRRPPHPVRIHRRFTEPGRQPVIDDCANRRANARDQLQ